MKQSLLKMEYNQYDMPIAQFLSSGLSLLQFFLYISLLCNIFTRMDLLRFIHLEN